MLLGGGGVVLLVHNEIHYVPIGDSWEEELVRNVLHYVPVLSTSLRFRFGDMVEKHVKVPPRFELGSLDSESKVLTITPWNWLV